MNETNSQLPTLGQLWANNVVDSLDQQQNKSTPNVDAGMNIANQKIQKRAVKKQAMADSLISSTNVMQGM